jgi:hypothetical protein
MALANRRDLLEAFLDAVARSKLKRFVSLVVKNHTDTQSRMRNGVF